MSENRPSTGRHLLVLGVLIVALIGGGILVVTGRNRPSTAPATTMASPLLRSLGTVASADSARTLVAKLNPVTLAAKVSPSTADSAHARPAPTEASVARCTTPLQQQTTDRTLGGRLAAASLDVAGQWALVVSYRLPASGKKPAGTRMIVADALSCRALLAISG